MAGDWIEVQHATPSKPEVLAIAASAQIHPDEALGKLIRLWCWFDENTTDGNARGVTFVTLDRYIGAQNFCAACNAVGWLSEENGASGPLVRMPKFDLYFSESAKRRAKTRKRVKRFRNARGNAPVTLQRYPTEQNRTEFPPTPQGGLGGSSSLSAQKEPPLRATSKKAAKTGKPREPDAFFDACLRLVYGEPKTITPKMGARIGRLSTDFKALTDDPTEIERRYRAAMLRFDRKASLNAVIQHWASLAGFTRKDTDDDE